MKPENEADHAHSPVSLSMSSNFPTQNICLYSNFVNKSHFRHFWEKLKLYMTYFYQQIRIMNAPNLLYSQQPHLTHMLTPRPPVYLWYSLVRLIRCISSGLSPLGIFSSALLRGTLSPVSRFSTVMACRISC